MTFDTGSTGGSASDGAVQAARQIDATDKALTDAVGTALDGSAAKAPAEPPAPTSPPPAANAPRFSAYTDGLTATLRAEASKLTAARNDLDQQMADAASMRTRAIQIAEDAYKAAIDDAGMIYDATAAELTDKITDNAKAAGMIATALAPLTSN